MMVRIAILGYGYWGPHVARNFQKLDNCSVAAICDVKSEALQRAHRDFPQAIVTSDFNTILASSKIDAIAIVTPGGTHFEVAESALKNRKHIFVEKPFTSTCRQAERLIELAERAHLLIMVDHTFLFTGAVRGIRQLADRGALGRLYYYDSTRANLGIFQNNLNVIWDLACHDLSIVDYLAPNHPEYVVATGQSHYGKVENVAFVTVYYTDRMIAHINVSWLAPFKVRTTLIGSEKLMVVWNDLETDEKLRLYDRGVQMVNREDQDRSGLPVHYRLGDIWVPKIDQTEALSLETRYFIDCVSGNQRPFNDGRAGWRIVRLLEAADESLKNHGAPSRL